MTYVFIIIILLSVASTLLFNMVAKRLEAIEQNKMLLRRLRNKEKRAKNKVNQEEIAAAVSALNDSISYYNDLIKRAPFLTLFFRIEKFDNSVDNG